MKCQCHMIHVTLMRRDLRQSTCSHVSLNSHADLNRLGKTNIPSAPSLLDNLELDALLYGVVLFLPRSHQLFIAGSGKLTFTSGPHTKQEDSYSAFWQPIKLRTTNASKFIGTEKTRRPVKLFISWRKIKRARRSLKMGSEAEIVRKPRILCLHGFRTSGEIFKKQMKKWPQQVLDKIDLVFPDGPYPAQGKSDVEGIFDPPYYEWFQFNKVRLSFILLCFRKLINFALNMILN